MGLFWDLDVYLLGAFDQGDRRLFLGLKLVAHSRSIMNSPGSESESSGEERYVAEDMVVVLCNGFVVVRFLGM